MGYTRTIKRYSSAGSLIGTVAPTEAECRLSAFKGCLGGSVAFFGTVRDTYDLDAGDIIKFFYNSSDSVPYYAGKVVSRRKILDAFRHEYELAGLWREVENNAEITAGQTFANTTVAAIVTSLASSYVTPNCPNVTGTSISASQSVSSYEVKTGESVADHLMSLKELAGGSGGVYATGVDASGTLYFKEISTSTADLQAKVTVSSNAIRADEITESQGRRDRLVVVSDINSAGYVTKKEFAFGAGATRPAVVRPPGMTKNADLTAWSTGWGTKYSSSTIQAENVQEIRLDSAADPPLPWNGQAKYEDLVDGDITQNYISEIRARFGEVFDYDMQMGFTGSGDNRDFSTDPYEPRESLTQRDIEDIGRENATDVDEPSSTAPRYVTPGSVTRLRPAQIDSIDTGGDGVQTYTVEFIEPYAKTLTGSTINKMLVVDDSADAYSVGDRVNVVVFAEQHRDSNTNGLIISATGETGGSSIIVHGHSGPQDGGILWEVSG